MASRRLSATRRGATFRPSSFETQIGRFLRASAAVALTWNRERDCVPRSARVNAACTSSTSLDTMSVSLNTFICSPVAASRRYERPAPRPRAATFPRARVTFYRRNRLDTRRGRAASDPRDSPSDPFRWTTRRSSATRGPARIAATSRPGSGPSRVVCASCGEAQCTPSCACSRCATQRASRRAFVAAAGLGPLLFSRAATAAPSPTNVDDMEARKMAREEMLKAARAKAAAQAAAEAAAAAPAPAPASN